MRLSVIIPTYRRPNDLPRLFDSIYKQKEQPEEILVIIGPGDLESLIVTKEWSVKLPGLIIFEAKKPSVVHSLNLGLSIAKEEIICFVDDDVWLPPDWSLKIKNAFRNSSTLGAYGGRDFLQLPDEPHLSNPPLANVVGKFRWNGTLEGNHHCGAKQSPIKVDVLKGCNLSFRRSAFKTMQIESALEGQGAEICWEIDICQHILLNGFEIQYDNNNYVLHFVSTRLVFDNRSDLFAPAWRGRLFNEALIVAKFRPIHELFMFWLRTFLIGSKVQPGFIRAFFLLNKHSWKVLLLPWRNAIYMNRGFVAGLRRRH